MNFVDQMIISQIHPVVVDWSNRVQQNGGTTPTPQTITAANNFYVGLNTSGLLSKMRSVNIYAPESLVNIRVPLIVDGSNGIWANTGFIDSDVTKNGLTGAAAKFLDTGFIPNSSFASDNNAGVTLYVYTGNSNNELDCGVWASAGSNQMAMYVNFGTSTFFDCWNAVGGRISAVNAAWQGYISFNRTSATASAIYKASSTVTHTTVASSTTESSIGSRPLISLYIGHMNGNAGNSTKTFSFMAMHDGFTITESASFFQLVQTLKQQMGGGYR